MKIMMSITILLSMNFIFMKHPLSMGSILLMQTMLTSIICMFYMNSYFFSYILFLVFIGGMLILFMYMSSIASNEKFYFSMKLLILNMIIWILIMIMNTISFKMDSINKLLEMNNLFDSFMIKKLYMFPSGMMTIMLVIYLLFTLIVVVNIISIKLSPLRSKF
uniref:NADH-ubiquinone oxidoreductase chain 6 n=2 Tax=decula group TaxID=254008 RepID=A0A482DRA0_9HEMI|nr:NADH dehydrogenase subunit 6 [Magicicada septendecula]YP_009590133.1 NADH dehydrogenase subunit 6 [Magicicada tredecula]AWV83715.1 NADH dehydrogenase subunit 6 [Magicicada tredecula]QBM09105.1 NADH dehydrogenase subunit 6 [Magicicada septendecula]QBM09118.1 NADH dehydrogenase subunit 6 [Magicicada septendecula]QBM09131.1 NADH dehydrogenase subunit 6 [Magicicada septendecula]QBM09144.1 NADH dehydrogenase subunit 6 [Magicicada septendecula]